MILPEKYVIYPTQLNGPYPSSLDDLLSLIYPSADDRDFAFMPVCATGDPLKRLFETKQIRIEPEFTSGGFLFFLDAGMTCAESRAGILKNFDFFFFTHYISRGPLVFGAQALLK